MSTLGDHIPPDPAMINVGIWLFVLALASIPVSIIVGYFWPFWRGWRLYRWARRRRVYGLHSRYGCGVLQDTSCLWWPTCRGLRQGQCGYPMQRYSDQTNRLR